MNPFDLHGFAFLTFYLMVGTATVVGLRAWLRHLETVNAPSRPDMTDPYLIAHLRAGGNEALRVATVSLIDRGLIDAKDNVLTTTSDDAVDLAQRPIEKAVLKKFITPGKAFDIFKDAAAMVSCNSYERTLEKQGMIASSDTYGKRIPWVLGAMFLLVAITVIKVDLAFSQGRHNVGFLIFLTIMFCIFVLVAWRKRRTGAGDAMLADLKVLFARLNGRASALRPGGQTNEAALLAAVFGLAALPSVAFPFTKKLYPARATDGSSCGSSCSSSSSCGSSCGGGCGGGGCGG